jgi:hypothetical protein
LVCSRCGHDNPELNRFCGMCGTRLQEAAGKNGGAETQAEPAAASVRTATRSSSQSILGLESEMPSRRSEPARRGSPIAGRSFLGLSSGGSHPDTSYLLDDDESSGHAGLWVTLVLMIAAVGAGFHFRNELRPRAYQAYAAAYAAVEARLNPQPEAPAQAPAAVPQTGQRTDSPTISTESSKAAQSDDAAKPANAAADPQKADSEPSKPADASADSAAEKSAEPEKPTPALSAKSDRETEPKPAHKAAGRQSSVRQRTTEASPDDTRLLQLARRYIHGQGVARNCEQGLSYLRQAVKRPIPEAASQMGALYATGTCVPQDRLAAYRWFSTALRMDPDNSWLSRERDELYGQMSSSERRQAER